MLARRSKDWNAGWPSWNGSWPGADASLADPALVAGIAAYRRHPSERRVPELPILWREGGTRLLDAGGSGRPVLFVPSLVNRAHVLDLDLDRSMVRWFAAQGTRPLLLDWGWPGPLERAFTLTDYVAGRLERALLACGGPVVLVGYCMGGLLALAAALRRPELVDGLALLATPWDFHVDETAHRLSGSLPMLESVMASAGTLPVDALQTLFTLADAGGAADRYRAFGRMDQGSARAHMFVALEDWLNDGIPLAAPVARECLGGWYGANTPARGEWRVAGQAVLPKAWRGPCLMALPARDRVVPPASARALAQGLPHAEVLEMAAGHIGMVVGGTAPTELWTRLLGWVRTLG